jgi:dipeptidyl aminopeptidase/acylaminoacyl peptidase
VENAVTYRSDGLKINAIIFRLEMNSDSNSRLPALILNHGGTDGISDSTKARARDFARAGFAVFASAYRGEDGSQGKIEIAKGEVDDVLNGMNWFVKQPYVDSSRVTMLGSSHGALIGLLVAARTSKLRALVFAYGIADIYAWYAYLVNTHQLGEDALTKATYGKGPSDKPENFLERFGLRVVPELPVSLPVLILQGAKDTVVPPDQAQRLARALDAQGQPYDLELYPNSEHGFLIARESLEKKYGKASVQVKESLQAFQSAVAFMKKALQ